MADLFSRGLPSSKPFDPGKIFWCVLSSRKRLPAFNGTANCELRLAPLIHLGFLDLPLWLPRTFQRQLLVPFLVASVDLVQAIQVGK
jgi:hypothetical protein